MLPKSLDKSKLVADPAGRAGHWYDPTTDTVVSMPKDWNPESGAAPAAAKAPEAPREDVLPAAPIPPQPIDPTPLTRGQLMVKAKELGIPKFQTMSNPDLTKAILDAQTAQRAAQEQAATPKPASTIEPGLDMTGKPVAVLAGRLEGKKGVVTETGDGEEFSGVRVLIDGTETVFDNPREQLRLLTPEEITEDDAARAAEQKP